MGAATLEQESHCVNELSGNVAYLNEKSVREVNKFIDLSTSKENLDKSEKLLAALEMVNKILKLDIEINDDLLKPLVDSINVSLLRINKMFDLVKEIFEYDGKSGIKIRIDDDNMIGYLSNMQKCKRLMEYIPNLVGVIIHMNKLNKGESKSYSSLDEFLKAS